jgi:hypothetical protein
MKKREPEFRRSLQRNLLYKYMDVIRKFNAGAELGEIQFVRVSIIDNHCYPFSEENESKNCHDCSTQYGNQPLIKRSNSFIL